MSGRKDEDILALCAAGPRLGILLHHLEVEGGHDVRAAHRSSRMPGTGGAHHPDDVPAHLRSDFSQFFDVCHIGFGLIFGSFAAAAGLLPFWRRIIQSYEKKRLYLQG